MGWDVYVLGSIGFGCEPGLRGVNQTYLYSSSLGLGHGMAMPLQSLEPGFVGAWLAVPQTQREELNL